MNHSEIFPKRPSANNQFVLAPYLCFWETKQGGPAEIPGTLNRTQHVRGRLHEEERTYERYNGSYAQDVEGWSDQDIDDVFDGDPDAYWNID